MSTHLERWLAYQVHGRIAPRITPQRAKRAPRRSRSDSEPQYLAFVRKLPCLVCYADFWAYWLNLEPGVRVNLVEMVETLNRGAVQHLQDSPTEAAHLGFSSSVRGIGQKYPDLEAGPLCRGHHREFKTAHHQASAGWWGRNLPDLDRDSMLKALGEIYWATERCWPWVA
jgi:hypothetical protein